MTPDVSRIDDAFHSAGSEPVEVTVAGELDVARSELSSAIDDALANGACRLVINLLDVSFIDSSVLRVLVLARREVESRGGWIRLVYTNHLIGRVIEVTGLADVLPQYASVESALAGHHVGEEHTRAEGSRGS
jgi:anti-anti-sigma factor